MERNEDTEVLHLLELPWYLTTLVNWLPLSRLKKFIFIFGALVRSETKMPPSLQSIIFCLGFSELNSFSYYSFLVSFVSFFYISSLHLSYLILWLLWDSRRKKLARQFSNYDLPNVCIFGLRKLPNKGSPCLPNSSMTGFICQLSTTLYCCQSQTVTK